MFGTQQFAGQQMRPQQYQYSTVSGYYPQQTNQMSSILSAMMPMIMMVMMTTIMMPMTKSVTGSSKS